MSELSMLRARESAPPVSIRARRSFACAVMIMLLGAIRAPHVSAEAERVWTRGEILAIADAEAKRLGYDVDHMGVAFDVYNSLWHETATNRAPETASADLLRKLEGRRYFAVYYSLMKEPMFGGGLFVFVDRASGDILGTLQDK